MNRRGLVCVVAVIIANCEPLWAQCIVQKVPYYPVGTAGLLAGTDVDIDATVAVVGGAGEHKQGVIVFRDDSLQGGWYEEQRILPPGGSVESFGHSVAVSGDTIVVGAPYATVNGIPRAGAVYVYDYDSFNKEWEFVQHLRGPYEDEDDHFGMSLDAYSGMIVVGAPNDAGRANIARIGQVITFENLNGSDWEITSILGPISASEQGFGQSIALHRDRAMIVGGSAYPGGPQGSGLAYVYDRIEDSYWSLDEQLFPNEPTADDHFGSAVALAGEIAVVGSPGAGDDLGAAYVFRYNGFNWFEDQRIVSSDAISGDRFGHAVASNAIEVLVSSVNETEDTGAITLFEFDLIRWESSAHTRLHGSRFGNALAMDHLYAIASAPLDDQLGVDSGAAYIYTEFPYQFLGDFGLSKITPAVASQTNVVSAVCVQRSSRVAFLYSDTVGATELDDCPGVFVLLQDPILFDTAVSDDETGRAIASLFVPGQAQGQTIYVQAVDLDHCEVSNRAETTIK